MPGCSKPPDPAQLLADARQYRLNGDNKAAVIQLRNLLQQHPNDAEARYLLGSIYVEFGSPLSGEKELRTALDLGYDSATVLPSLATALLQQGRYEQVLEETRVDPLPAAVFVVRGTAEAALGRIADAERSYARSLELEPNYSPALLGQARLALAQADLRKANDLVDRVIAADPRNVEAWLLRSDIRYVEKNIGEALAACSTAVEVQPDRVIALLRRASLLAEKGDFDAAQADVDAARTVAPGNPRSGKPVPCSGPHVTTVYENLGANNVANAVVFPEIIAILDSAGRGGYNVIQADIRWGAIRQRSPAACAPLARVLNNGFEQVFIGQLNPTPGPPSGGVPEPATLALVSIALLGGGFVQKRQHQQ